MSLESWKKDIDDFIPKLIEGEINEKNSILLSSLFSLKHHFKRMDEESTLSNHKADKTSDYEAVDGELDKQWLLDTINDELSDSEKYYNKYLETKISEYKDISKQELHHAEILFKILKEKYSDTDIQELMVWHNSILARLI